MEALPKTEHGVKRPIFCRAGNVIFQLEKSNIGLHWAQKIGEDCWVKRIVKFRLRSFVASIPFPGLRGGRIMVLFRRGGIWKFNVFGCLFVTILVGYTQTSIQTYVYIYLYIRIYIYIYIF